MKKIKVYLCLCATIVALLTSCTTTKYGMTKATFEETVEEVKYKVQEKGYYLSSENIGTGISAAFTNTRDAKNSVWDADLANAKANVYHFEDSAGNTFEFTVGYNEALSGNTMYLLDATVLSCQTSNPKDYMSLCGKQSAVNAIEVIPKDKPVVVGDMAKSIKAALWGCGIFCVGAIIVGVAVIGGM
jgi:hypothetical protein